MYNLIYRRIFGFIKFKNALNGSERAPVSPGRKKNLFVLFPETRGPRPADVRVTRGRRRRDRPCPVPTVRCSTSDTENTYDWRCGMCPVRAATTSGPISFDSVQN